MNMMIETSLLLDFQLIMNFLIQCKFNLHIQHQESDDNRYQEQLSFCKQDMLFGCSPYARGE